MGKSQKNYMSIKSKLMAAVAMLLVASFMVVSSTYAWFTLSTAPEVTGITTRVGANGNLEIALYTGPIGEGEDTDIQSNVGDSNKEKVEKNKTWGNIVDLDDEAYGLDKITLLPSVMNIAGGVVPSTGILATPVYGADGRIQTLATQSIAATYDAQKQLFAVGSDTVYGVKAIGTTSGMSQQQLLHRTAISDLRTNLSLANKAASDALVNNGGTLAALVLKKANDATEFDVTAIGDLLSDLEGTNGNGVADYLEKAMTSYLIAAAALAMNDLTDDAFANLVTLIKNDCTDGTFPDLSASYEIGGYSVANLANTAIAQVYAKYAGIKAAIAEAKQDYVDLGDDKTKVDWQKVNGLLTSTTAGQSIVYVDGITVNGFSAEELTAKDPVTQEYINLGTLVTSVLNSGALKVELREGTGVFFDIAQATDKNVVAGITLPDGLSIKGIPVGNMKATMTTILVDEDGTDHGIKLIAQAPDSIPNKEGIADEKKLADYYGYAIDLAFRTNAKDSHLMLQTTATNRVYSDGTNAELMGHGSTMTFGYDNEGFNAQQVINLMESIRIVFVDSTGAPVAYAGLNTEDAALKVTDDNENVVEAPINLYTGVVTKEISDGSAEGKITTLDFSAATFASENAKGQTQLVALEQNKQTVLTAYVYLDGETVTNADVATGAISMTGSMNLQFSSDADLVPMNYSPLQGTTETTENGGEAVNP